VQREGKVLTGTAHVFPYYWPLATAAAKDIPNSGQPPHCCWLCNGY